VDAAGRSGIDALVARESDRLSTMDPDELLARVDDAVARARADLELAREDRRVTRGFLAVQGRLDGSSTFYGEADADSTATFLEALDARAERPVAQEDDALSRGQQRFDAFIAICEDSLNSGSTRNTRPRPRLIATIDIAALG